MVSISRFLSNGSMSMSSVLACEPVAVLLGNRLGATAAMVLGECGAQGWLGVRRVGEVGRMNGRRGGGGVRWGL